MIKRLLTLEEVLAMLETVGLPAHYVEKFTQQAELVIGRKPKATVDHVTVSSGFGQKSQRGFVELTIDDTLTQMDAGKAREIGLFLLQASEAAQSDEIFVKFFDQMGIEGVGRAQLLLKLRELRQGTTGVSFPS